MVFNIQRFSIQDGPGIRTTVFVKGCPLKCKWCCNPESISADQEIMVHDIKCNHCGRCQEQCPEGAIISDERDTRLDRCKCTHCMACVQACPQKALECIGNCLSVGEVLEEVKKDILFYQNSRGGVTISGGEPLLQWEFTRDFLQVCKEEGIHTALDTSGYAPWENIEEVLKHVDLVLYDIKQTDNIQHMKGTGVSNSLILKNLEKTASRVRTWLRVPLLPGYSDLPENIEKVAVLASQCNVEKVSLLVYHEWGKFKYEKLGRSYDFISNGEFSEKRLEEIKMVFIEKGIKITLNN